MRVLTGDKGEKWNSDKEKLKGISERNFRWKKEWEQECKTGGKTTGQELEALQEKVLKALSSTCNTFSPGLDGINYSLIKVIKNTILGMELFRQIAKLLKEGRIPKEWQKSKVVMIPKSGKNHEEVKG